jgi:tetratricopeptide (TPR) repeat protein
MTHFASNDRLLSRLVDAKSSKNEVVFLVGSGLTAPGRLPEEKGVPTAQQVVERVRRVFVASDDLTALDSELDAASASLRYQTAIQFLVDSRGPEALEELVRKIVLEARQAGMEEPDFDLRDLDVTDAGWSIREGVRSLGELFAKYPQIFPGPTLTTNFDPLIEIAIRKAGGRTFAESISNDGSLDTIHATASHRVVHLHGYWLAQQTLHTPLQLTRERPSLAGSLRSLLRQKYLVVLGYGGWEDVFTKVLVDVISEGASELKGVLWAFYSADEKEIRESNAALLRKLDTGSLRISYYKGVDCNNLLPALATKLGIVRTIELPTTTIGHERRHESPYVAKGPPRKTARLSESDSPPIVSAWVGREAEMKQLAQSTARVVSVSGFGGHGKSALSAKYLQDAMINKKYDFWDWRDCKEENYQIHTQLARVIERLSAGAVEADSLNGEEAGSLVRLLFTTLGDRRGLFVFDNVDSYVDPQGKCMVGVLKMLFDQALQAPHNSQFFFTCRPQISDNSAEFVQFRLEGLSLPEAEELFRRRKAFPSGAEWKGIVARIHTLTQGHPMWLNLIANQIANNSDVNALLLSIERGQGDLPANTLSSIWDTLKPREQTVLRHLAEAVRPETVERIERIVSGSLNWNHFSKAIKTLRALDLVVVKRHSSGGGELIELHPLIRDYVRRRYPKSERKKFAAPIITFIDAMISRLGPDGIMDASALLLDQGIAKAEIHINCGEYLDALAVLDRLGAAIRVHGSSEDYARTGLGLASLMDWQEACLQKADVLDGFVAQLSAILVELGYSRDAHSVLQAYEAVVPGRGAQFINLCNSRCYVAWYQQDYVHAIQWGAIGEDIKRQSNIDTNYSVVGNLALANRDSGNADGDLARVNEAMIAFLGAHKLESLLAPNTIINGLGGATYGNVGRCLQFLGRTDDALLCYRKSLFSLGNEKEARTQGNIGWGALWVGEVFEAKQDWVNAVLFYRKALLQWRSISPPKYEVAANRIGDVIKSHPAAGAAMEDWAVDAKYRRWVGDVFRVV